VASGAGWYDDPEHPGTARWYDGTAWGPSQFQAPAPHVGPPVPSTHPASAVAQEPATPWGQGTSPWVAPFGATSSSVDASWGFRLGAFLISSVAFVLLCIPFFIAALVVSYDYVQSLFNGSSPFGFMWWFHALIS